MADMPVIQGSADIFTTRQTGLPGAQKALANGDIEVDHMARGNTEWVDRALSATGESNPPPQNIVADQPIRADFDAGFPGHPGVVPGVPLAQMAGNVLPSDKPVEGRVADPRDMGAPPQVITALPEIKKAPIVPIVISASGVVQVGDEGAKSAKAAKAAKTAAGRIARLRQQAGE